MFRKPAIRAALTMFVYQFVLLEARLAYCQDFPSLRSLRSQMVEGSLVRIALGSEMRKQLGLSNEQIAVLTAESERSDSDMLRLNREIVLDKSLSDDDKRAALVKGLEEINDKVSEVLEETLTPSQKTIVLKRFINERLEQETLQTFFSDPGIAKFLSMDGEQQKSTLGRALELDNELNSEFRELRRRKLEQLLKERLTVEQRSRFENLLESK